VSTSVVKWSEGLRNRVSYYYQKIYRPYGVLLLLSYSFVSIMYHCIYGCMFCIFLFHLVYYVFFLLCLCIHIVMYVPF
jgi:hypothetical protein